MKPILTGLRIIVLGSILFPAADFAAAAAAPGKPNILVIVSDDHGYADAGFQGSTEIPTPHLDRLAKSGVQFTSGYVSHPFCSPTRAGLMTGRYQHRFGHVYNPDFKPRDAKEGLPLSEKILPEYLRPAGYVTGWIGKWHLGTAPVLYPEHRGFDETFGFYHGGHQFIDWKTNNAIYNQPLFRNGQFVDVPEHLTTRFGAEAVAFAQRHQQTPWFLYLAFNAPHTPHQPTAERAAKFAHIQNVQRSRYAAQISLMDDAIGEVMAALDATQQRERTLIFFFSDNGGPLNAGTKNTPLRGAKGDVLEGGVRVPFLVSWPGQLAAGRKYDQPVSSLDIFATSLGVAGVKLPTDKPYDSVNLLPQLRGETKIAPHERLFWRIGTGQQAAVREGDWKLVRYENEPDELYHLSSDIGEALNLATEQPEKLKHLATALSAWEKEMPAPAFIGTSLKNPNQRSPKPKPAKSTAAPAAP